jgi:hypothetical protein
MSVPPRFFVLPRFGVFLSEAARGVPKKYQNLLQKAHAKKFLPKKDTNSNADFLSFFGGPSGAVADLPATANPVGRTS